MRRSAMSAASWTASPALWLWPSRESATAYVPASCRASSTPRELTSPARAACTNSESLGAVLFRESIMRAL
jgi:hypothetical protein